jgi:hypothetical protein
VTADLVGAALADVPADWLATGPAAYADRLLARVAARAVWVPPLVEAAAAGAGERTPTRGARPSWLDGGWGPPEGSSGGGAPRVGGP